jgi:hypothetical protein
LVRLSTLKTLSYHHLLLFTAGRLGKVTMRWTM